jgi:hypothetical protein
MSRQIWKILGTSIMALAILAGALGSTVSVALAASPSPVVPTLPLYFNSLESRYQQWLEQFGNTVCHPDGDGDRDDRCVQCFVGDGDHDRDDRLVLYNSYYWPYGYYGFYGPYGRFLRYVCVAPMMNEKNEVR